MSAPDFAARALAAGTRNDLAADDGTRGSSLVGFRQAGTGAIGRNALEKLREIVHVRDFGAIGNGVVDDTDAVQAAIDFCASGTSRRGGLGATLALSGIYLCRPLTIRSGVHLIGGRPGHRGGYNTAPSSGSTLKAKPGSIPDDGYFLQFEANVDDASIVGLNILGEGSLSKSGGVRGTTGGAVCVAHCTLRNWGLEAFTSTAMRACWFYNNFLYGLQNAAYCTERGYHTGALRLERNSGIAPGGVDWMVFNNEFAASSNPAVAGASLYLAAAYYHGLTAASVYNNRYEVGDCGVSHFGNSNRFSHETYDTIAGHGIYGLDGDSNLFTNLTFSRNGFDSYAAYDQIHVPSTSSFNRNRFVGIKFEVGTPPFGVATTCRSLIYDKKAGSTFVNSYAEILAPMSATNTLYAGVPFDVAGQGASVEVAQGRGAYQATATPSAFNARQIVTNNASAITITNFVDGTIGQRLLVVPNDAVTSVQHTSGIVHLRAGRGAKLLRSPTEFIKLGSGAWQEVGDYEREALAFATPGTIGAGGVGAIGTITVSGATLGDGVLASWQGDLAGLRLHAWVSATNTVSYQFHNPTAVSIALSSGANLRVKLIAFST